MKGMTGPHARRAIATPLGEMIAVASSSAVVGLEFADRGGPAASVAASGCADGERILDQLARELSAYFAGARRGFGVPIDPPGTEFQRGVWAALRAIEPGRTCSYAEVARTIGRPRAVRAVARANATNPVAILVPCHRVIGSDGSLTGYGGGLARKRWLLDHEGGGGPGLGG